MQKVPILSIIRATLGNLRWQIGPSVQYLHVHCNESACTKISDVDKQRWRIKNEWTVWSTLFIEHAVGDRQRLHSRIRAGGIHFEHMMYIWCDLLHAWRFLRHYLPVMFVAIQWFIKMYMQVLRWWLNLSLQISQGSASIYFKWSEQFLHSFSGTLQLHCELPLLSLCHKMSSVVCLRRECNVTKQLQTGSRSFHLKAAKGLNYLAWSVWKRNSKGFLSIRGSTYVGMA